MRIYITIGLLLLFLIETFSQVHEVSGRVIDADSRVALPFVNIVINDGQRGGTSDIDGKFSLRSSEDITFLSLSYVGYEPTHFEVNNKSRNLLVKLKKKEYELPEYVVFPDENPAHRIIDNAILFRDYNDPEKLPGFSYTSYDKMIFTFELDSIPALDSISIDSTDKAFFEKHHLFIMESISERKFMFPNKNNEKVIATKVAGFKDPIFVFLLSQIQSTSFYKEMIKVSNKTYINPISKGSTRKYFFLLQDTLYTETNDSVFVISFRPRQNTNFDGLEGVISINTNNWAIQNVIAEPYGVKGGVSLRLEQMYEYVQGKQWFPVQLNTIAILNNVAIDDSATQVNISIGEDTSSARIDMPFGFGKSYIKNINLDPELKRSDFGSVVVDVDPEATFRDDEFWKGYRIDSLSEKEINTYVFVDSISKEENFERTAKTIESLMTGKIPWWYFDIDINRFIRYNSYEGFALGAGLHTNDRLSQVFKIGGFFRYGFKDKTFKYGGDLQLSLYRNWELEADLEYMKDVSETSGLRFFDEKPAFFKPEYFRHFLVNRMDKTILYRGSIGFRAFKYLKMNVGLAKINKQVTNDYQYGISEDNVKVFLNQFDFTEVQIGLKYAYGEKIVQNMRKRISMGTKYPIFWFQYTRGIRGFLGGEYDYNRYDFKIEDSFYTKYLGETSIKLVAGYIDSDIPYTNLYNGNGAYRVFTIFAPNSFATMRMNEFLSNKYIALYFTHNFGKLLFQAKKFKPEFAIATNIGFGVLDFEENHYNIDYQTMEHGYYESGLQINNLLNLRLYSLGIACYYRYGPYSLSGWDNVAAKFTLYFNLGRFNR